MNTNLEPANSYYEVVKPFSIYVLTGHQASNEFYGAAQFQRPTYTKVKTKRGDRIANLKGGLFFQARHARLADHAVMTIDQRSAFERGAAPTQEFPLDRIKEIAEFRLEVSR